MEKGTKGNGKEQFNHYATFCVLDTPASYARSSNAQGYRQVAKMNNENKTTGSYERYTAREEFSTGEMYRGRGSREYGVKDEYKISSTVKVGHKSGYTEYYKEERVRNVSYGGNSRSNNYGGSKSGASNNSAVATNNYSYGGGGNNYSTYYDSDSDSD